MRLILTNRMSGSLSGIRRVPVAYDDQVDDVTEWMRALRDAASPFVADGDTIAGVLIRYTARPTNKATEVRDTMARRLDAAVQRLILEVPTAELAWTLAAVAARPHPTVRTFVTDDIATWVASHTNLWPEPGEPRARRRLGLPESGDMVRHGPSPHAPWGVCITDPVPPDTEVVEP